MSYSKQEEDDHAECGFELAKCARETMNQVYLEAGPTDNTSGADTKATQGMVSIEGSSAQDALMDLQMTCSISSTSLVMRRNHVCRFSHLETSPFLMGYLSQAWTASGSTSPVTCFPSALRRWRKSSHG